MYFHRPSPAAILCLLAAALPCPVLGRHARGGHPNEPSCAEPWARSLSPKLGAEDELSLLQATHEVARGAERELDVHVGANTSSERRPALAQGLAFLNSSSGATDPEKLSGSLASSAPRQSLLEAWLEAITARSVSGSWMQDATKVAESMVTGMTPMEMTLLIVGVLLSLIGFSYFLVAYAMSDKEELPGRISHTRNASARSLPMPPKRGSPSPSRGSLTPVAVLQKYSLGIPSIKDAPYEHSKKSDFEIKDSSGKKLLNVEVMRPFLDSDAEIGTPHEYVSLHSKDGEEELAMCALAPSGDGQWECNVYQGETELYGHIVPENGGLFSGDVQFVLISPKNERLLVLRGRPLERRMEVLDSNGVPSAVVDRGNFSFGKPGEYYQAECLLDADVGLIVLSLLAVDRLLAHSRQNKR